MVEGVQQGPVLVGTFFTPKTGPPKRHRGTTQRKPATPNQEQRPTGVRDTETCRHTPRWKKKRASSPARKTGDWGTGTTRPGTGTASNRNHKAKTRHAKKSAKNTPRQPNQKGRGTAETQAQHARPHSAPQPGKASNKRGTRTNTHPRTAPPTRRCRRPRGTGA